MTFRLIGYIDLRYRLLPQTRQPEIMVLGVEPAIINYGMHLSPVVEDSLPRVVATARKIVHAW